MEPKNLKKLLSGLSVLGLLTGIGLGATGCASTQTQSDTEVKHPTPGSKVIRLTS
jgi:radical SAM modification target selenobiotic family peptide